MFDHFDNAFTDIEAVLDLVPDWAEKRWNFAILETLPSIDAAMLPDVANGFTKRRTSADDGIVIEMILACNEHVLEILAQMFRLRILNHESEDGENVWNEHIVNLIGKKNSSTCPKTCGP